MGLTNGLTTTSYNGQAIHAYKLSENEHLGLVSLPYGQVQDIAKFMDVTEDGDGNKIKINFVLNCHYFDMAGGTNGYLGRCQSFTANGTTIGVGEDGYVGYDGTATGDKPYTDLVVLHDGTIKYGDFNSWDYTDVMIGVAPAGIQLDNGEDKNWYSPACGYSKITTANTQSLLIKFDDGRFGLVAVSGKLSPLTCRDWTKSVGGVHQSCYDSGGSTQCCIRNEDDSVENVVYTGRKIPTAFVAYTIVGEEEGGTGGEVVPEEPGDSGSTEVVITHQPTYDAFSRFWSHVKNLVDTKTKNAVSKDEFTEEIDALKEEIRLLKEKLNS